MNKFEIELDDLYSDVISITLIGGKNGITSITSGVFDLRNTKKIKCDNEGNLKKIEEGK